ARPGGQNGDRLTGAVCLMLLFLGLAVVPWLRYSMARQTWRNVKGIPVRHWIGQHAIRTDTPECSVTTAWSAHDRHRQAVELVLLGSSGGTYEMFPRSHCVREADWDTFLALVKSKTKRA